MTGISILKNIKTVELVTELKKREGVRTEYAEPHTDKKNQCKRSGRNLNSSGLTNTSIWINTFYMGR